MEKKILKLGVAAIAVIASAAHAAGTTAVTTAVSDQFTTTTTDIATVGGLLVGLAVLSLAFRWIKAMMF